MAFNPNPYGYQPQQFYPGTIPDHLQQYRPQSMPMQQAPAPIPQPQSPAPTGGIVWVGSEQEAYGHMMAPNSAVALWDMNAPVIYLKKTDAAGKPSMEVFDLVPRTNAPRKPDTGSLEDPAQFVTREEFNALAAMVARLEPKERPGKRVKEVDV